MKGYKVFASDWTCLGFQYEVGKTYEMDATEIRLCDKGLHFGSTCLFGLFRRNHGGERHVAEGIHEQIVVECAQEAYFCGHHCIVVGEVFEVLVAVSDTYAKTIVVATQHRVAGIISVVAIGGNTVVTPSAVSFIGGELVAVPHLTEEAGCTAVNTVHIAVAVGTAITGKTEVGVALVEQIFSVNGGLHCWVDWRNMQVVDARCHTCREQECSSWQDVF